MTTKTTPTRRDPSRITAEPSGQLAIGRRLQRIDRVIDRSVDTILASDGNA